MGDFVIIQVSQHLELVEGNLKKNFFYKFALQVHQVGREEMGHFIL